MELNITIITYQNCKEKILKTESQAEKLEKTRKLLANRKQKEEK